jgi:hypothetical protein
MLHESNESTRMLSATSRRRLRLALAVLVAIVGLALVVGAFGLVILIFSDGHVTAADLQRVARLMACFGLGALCGVVILLIVGGTIVTMTFILAPDDPPTTGTTRRVRFRPYARRAVTRTVHRCANTTEPTP